jgi:hypothetical protein
MIKFLYIISIYRWRIFKKKLHIIQIRNLINLFDIINEFKTALKSTK